MLERKRTEKQTISISPALKDWIERFVQKKHNENPDSEKYRSISAFYNYILECALKFLKSGKNFGDLNKQKKESKADYLDGLTFRAILSLHEEWLKMNRYRGIDIRRKVPLLITIRKSLINDKNLYNFSDLEEVFEKCIDLAIPEVIGKNLSYHLTKSRKLEDIKLTCEHVGAYKNLQYENLKFLSIILGFLGVELTDFFYSERDSFAQLSYITTQLFFSKKIIRNRRIKLVQKNLDFFKDYSRLLNDFDPYFWMEMSSYDNAFLRFINIKVLDNWIKKIEQDLEFLEMEGDIVSKLLEFFEKIHWIKVDNKKDLKFKFVLEKKQNKEEITFFKEIILKYAQIVQDEGNFSLKKRTNI